LQVLKADKHILLEKLAGINTNEIRDMLKAAEGYTKTIVIDHAMRFNTIRLYNKKHYKRKL